ncbi:hypothetical protein BDV3_000208 [Batrachochytrium dendrobatidis]
MSFLFGESQEKSLAQLSTHTRNGFNQETPLTDAPDTAVGAETSTMHFAISTKLGWIAWKESEASLYSIMERAFGATRCELKLSDFLDQMAMEVEIPNEQIDKFTKYFNQDTLAAEIDKLHGLEPVLHRYRDVKLSGLKRTLGSTLAVVNVKSSIDSLLNRVRFLESCGQGREREVNAILEIATNQMKDIMSKYTACVDHIDAKIMEKCEDKLTVVEDKILRVVRDDLSFIKELPVKLSHLTSAPITAPSTPISTNLTDQSQVNKLGQEDLSEQVDNSRKLTAAVSAVKSTPGSVKIGIVKSPIGKLSTPQQALAASLARLECLLANRNTKFPQTSAEMAAQIIRETKSTLDKALDKSLSTDAETGSHTEPILTMADTRSEESTVHLGASIVLDPAPESYAVKTALQKQQNTQDQRLPVLPRKVSESQTDTFNATVSDVSAVVKTQESVMELEPLEKTLQKSVQEDEGKLVETEQGIKALNANHTSTEENPW